MPQTHINHMEYHGPSPDSLAPQLARAARLLEAGALVAFPTETVYGLGADAENAAAVAKIYAAKGRPAGHPVIVHLAQGAALAHWVRTVPRFAHALIDAFWPGPLTLVFDKQPGVADACTGGQATIGLRCPSHPLAQALLREFRLGRGGLAAPSANRFGRISPTTAQHVRDELGDAVAMVLDGGPCAVGIESTIVDCSRAQPVLLRPGMVSRAQLEQVLGMPVALPDAAAPRVSGSLASHYAPRTPLELHAFEDLPRRIDQALRDGRRIGGLSFRPLARAPEAWRVLGEDAAQAAQGLYAALRELDALGLDLLLAERPRLEAAWQGIADRLQRAAHR
jgi:L-threonylcarbamoyladenylate synthase